jgi:hypothetical protein
MPAQRPCFCDEPEPHNRHGVRGGRHNASAEALFLRLTGNVTSKSSAVSHNASAEALFLRRGERAPASSPERIVSQCQRRGLVSATPRAPRPLGRPSRWSQCQRRGLVSATFSCQPPAMQKGRCSHNASAEALFLRPFYLSRARGGDGGVTMPAQRPCFCDGGKYPTGDELAQSVTTPAQRPCFCDAEQRQRTLSTSTSR